MNYHNLCARVSAKKIYVNGRRRNIYALSPAFFLLVASHGERRFTAEVESGGDGRGDRDGGRSAAAGQDESALAAILGHLSDL